MIQIINSKYDECQECGKQTGIFAMLGKYDAAGHYIQEGGGWFCEDCLREALEAIARERRAATPPAPEEAAP